MISLLSESLFYVYCTFRALLPWVLLAMLVLIWIGWAPGWKWVRNPWLRCVHLLFAAALVLDPLVEHLELYYMGSLSDLVADSLMPPGSYVPGSRSAEEIFYELIYFEQPAIVLLTAYAILYGLSLITFLVFPPWWRGRR